MGIFRKKLSGLTCGLCNTHLPACNGLPVKAAVICFRAPKSLANHSMKKIIICIATLMFLTLATRPLKAETLLPSDSTQTIKFAKVLLTRMDEINSMDKADLSATELKKLKKELRGIKGNLKELDGGTYVPLGTLVIVLLVPLMIFNMIQ